MAGTDKTWDPGFVSHERERERERCVGVWVWGEAQPTHPPLAGLSNWTGPGPDLGLARTGPDLTWA